MMVHETKRIPWFEHRRWRIALLIAMGLSVVLGGLWWSSQSRPLYQVTMLPSLGGKTTPSALNDRGQVVGFSEAADGEFHGFLWDRASGMEDLGVLEGRLDINNAGWIAGTKPDPNGRAQAFLCDPNGAVCFLGDLGGGTSHAHALNDRCQVVGESTTVDGSRHAFFWDRAGGMRRIVALTGKDNHVRSLNSAGLVYGTADMGDKPNQAFLWAPDHGMVTIAPPFVKGKVCDLNSRGQLLGKHRISSAEVHMVLWTQEAGIEKLFRLRGFPDLPAGTNDANQVVYEEWCSRRWALLEWLLSPLPSRWMLWDPGRGKTDLNGHLPRPWRDSFWVCNINEKGWIVGGAVKGKQGDTATFLLEPIAEKWEK